ncbi:MAG: portal protein [Desulfomonilaceae bacterium]
MELPSPKRMIEGNSTHNDLENLAKASVEYLRPWLKSSREFTKTRSARWKLLEDLYHNRRDLSSWNANENVSVNSCKLSGGADQSCSAVTNWQSDIILSPSYIVDTWADRAYQSIFSGPEWLTVIPEETFYSPATDDRYPTSFKLQELLVNRLAQGHVHARLYEALQSLCLFGTVLAKISWRWDPRASRRWDRNSLGIIEEQTERFDCPVMELIPLDRALIDWSATHSDVQRHSGTGHIVDKSREEIIEMFDRGVYNVNHEEFLQKWQTSYSSRNFESDHLTAPQDANGLSTPEPVRFWVWEWHGRIPGHTGNREIICAIVTEIGADSIDDGLIIRISDSPALWSGLRPFILAHYTPTPGPFGVGAVETNLDLIHSISQFLSQSQDNARLTANAMLVARRGSSVTRSLSEEDDFVYPGKVWLVDDPDDIRPFPAMGFPQAEVNALINYLNIMLEKRTSISDSSLGVSSRDKTATEAHILQESAMNTFATRADLFARTFVEPLGKLALSMIQQFLVDDQLIAVRDHSGLDVPLTVTTDEIQSGRYNVIATITRQDSTRVAKAQSIERALPTLAKFTPTLAEEGVRVSFSELIKRYLDLLGIDAVDRVFTRVQPNTDNQPGLFESQSDSVDRAESDNSYFPHRLVQNGGPLGSYPSDVNALAQFLQMNARWTS